MAKRRKGKENFHKSGFRYDTLSKPSETTPLNSKELPIVPNSDLRQPSGPALASKRDMTPICPISNLSNDPPDLPDIIPNEYQMEIYRLRRDNASLRDDIARKNDKIRKALLVLYDELQFWRTGMMESTWETYNQIQARMRHLESTIRNLEDFTLAVPVRSRQKTSER